eukprot:gene19940-7051_t
MFRVRFRFGLFSPGSKEDALAIISKAVELLGTMDQAKAHSLAGRKEFSEILDQNRKKGQHAAQ